MQFRERQIALPRFTVPPILLILSLINRFRNKIVLKKLLASDKICVELGTAGNNRPGWIGIDAWGGDINLDVTRHPLPFPDNSVDCFYASHVFEHFSYPEPMLSILKECHRVLKDGGTFSICVPNGAFWVDAYLNGKYPDRPSADFYQPALHNNSRMDILNYTAYMNGDHKHMFDVEGLLNILSKAGFQNVTQREFDPDLDLEMHDWESIYAAGTKQSLAALPSEAEGRP
ncbi:methyltransferase domain-containing protein [Mycobacterium sp. E2733]|uniref:class I SAM-dependent methyltransferase n=1 Tax=Mycobacterium sp. E2733 TaxID=1834138 RepID=UPI0018D4555D|nr:methyltransferase domain-containing protein [Mycobacterium sp. E2733]